MNELFIRLAFPIHFILSKDNGGQPKNYILWYYYQRPCKTDFITVRVLHLSHVLIVVWKEISRTFHGFTFKCCAFFTEKCLTISLILLVCYMLYVHFLNKEIFESQGVKVQYCRILRIWILYLSPSLMIKLLITTYSHSPGQSLEICRNRNVCFDCEVLSSWTRANNESSRGCRNHGEGPH